MGKKVTEIPNTRGTFLKRGWTNDTTCLPHTNSTSNCRLGPAMLLNVDIGNFSRRGILFVSPVQLAVDSSVDCIISITQWLEKDISFSARVKHCVEKNGSFIIGANIESVADANYFEVLVEVHDFVMRQHDARL
jgi:hypothetical protein